MLLSYAYITMQSYCQRGNVRNWELSLDHDRAYRKTVVQQVTRTSVPPSSQEGTGTAQSDLLIRNDMRRVA